MAELLAATGGVLRAGPAEGSEAAGVSTDSRTLARGELFVALAGPREQPVRIVLDGHRFVGDALRRGAWGVLVEEQALQREEVARELAAWPGRAVIVVPDSLRALGDLAAYHRRRMPARDRGHHRQQRQDHDQGDGLRDRRRALAGAAQRGEPEQSPRPAADAAGPGNRRTRSPSWRWG